MVMLVLEKVSWTGKFPLNLNYKQEVNLTAKKILIMFSGIDLDFIQEQKSVFQIFSVY